MEALEIGKRPVVLFDFDGTVADTGRAVMTSTRKALMHILCFLMF